MAKKSASAKSRKPLAIEVLLACDAVSRDPNSQKATIYGIFDKLHPSQYPSQVAFFIYAKLTGAVGPHKVRLDVVNERGKSSFGTEKMEVEFNVQPNRKVALVTRLEMPIAKAGMYEIQISEGKTLLGRCVIEAAKPSAQKKA